MPQADTINNDSSVLPFYQLTEPFQQTEMVDVNVGIPLDSLFRPCDTPDTVFRTTLFTGHKLTPQHAMPLERPSMGMPAWIFAVIMALCVLLSIYYRSKKLNLLPILKYTVENGAPERAVRGNVKGLALLPIALFLSAALSITVWTMAMQKTGPAGCLSLSLAIAMAYLIRNGMLRLLAATFNSKQAMNTYITCNYIYHLLLTTALTPLLFVLIYIPGAANITAYIIGGLTAFVFLIRILHGSKLFLTNSKGSSFFLFYYLCTIELAPPLIALKWLIL